MREICQIFKMHAWQSMFLKMREFHGKCVKVGRAGFVRCRRQQFWALKKRRYRRLHLVRTLLTIRQKYREPSLWEVMDSFVLTEYASLRASRTFLQQLLACLNFTLQTKKVICMNYESWTSSWYLLDTYLTWHLR